MTCPAPCHAFPSLLSVFVTFFFLYSFQSTKWMCLISNKRGVNSSHVCFLKAPLPAPHVWFASRLGAMKHLSRICKLPPWFSGKATAWGQTCPLSSSFAFRFEASWHPKNLPSVMTQISRVWGISFSVQSAFLPVSLTQALMPPSSSQEWGPVCDTDLTVSLAEGSDLGLCFPTGTGQCWCCLYPHACKVSLSLSWISWPPPALPGRLQAGA